jgi:hypothetical protein
MASSERHGPWFEQIGSADLLPFSTDPNTSLWPLVAFPLGFGLVPVGLMTLGGDLPLGFGIATSLSYCAVLAGLSLGPLARRTPAHGDPDSPVYWWVGSGALFIILAGCALGAAVAAPHYIEGPRRLYGWCSGAGAILLVAAGTLGIVGGCAR